MLKDLIKLANHLDSEGLLQEANYLDSIMAKYAEESKEENIEDATEVNYKVKAGDTMDDIGKVHTYPNTDKTLVDNLKLNEMKEKDIIRPGQVIRIWSTSSYEGFSN